MRPVLKTLLDQTCEKSLSNLVKAKQEDTNAIYRQRQRRLKYYSNHIPIVDDFMRPDDTVQARASKALKVANNSIVENSNQHSVGDLQ